MVTSWWEVRHRWCSLKVYVWFLVCAILDRVCGALLAIVRVLQRGMAFCRDRAANNIARMKRIREDATP